MERIPSQVQYLQVACLWRSAVEQEEAMCVFAASSGQRQAAGPSSSFSSDALRRMTVWSSPVGPLISSKTWKKWNKKQTDTRPVYNTVLSITAHLCARYVSLEMPPTTGETWVSLVQNPFLTSSGWFGLWPMEDRGKGSSCCVGPGGKIRLRSKRIFSALSLPSLFVPVVVIEKAIVTRVDCSQVFFANPEWCREEPTCFIPRNHLLVEREMPTL